MAAQSFLNLAVSSNARTNWITIALGVVFGLLSFFKIIPDLQTAQSLGNDFGNLDHLCHRRRLDVGVRRGAEFV